MEVKAEDFTNDNPNFSNVKFVIVDGGLTINASAEEVVVTITEHSADGDVRRDGEERDRVHGERTSPTSCTRRPTSAFSGTAEAKGTEEGFYPMEVKAEDFTNNNENFSNVRFVIVDGGLTINASAEEVVVTITEHSATETYDGTEKSVTGYTVTDISNELYKATDFSFSGTAEAKGTEEGFYPMEVKAEDFTNDNHELQQCEVCDRGWRPDDQRQRRGSGRNDHGAQRDGDVRRDGEERDRATR